MDEGSGYELPEQGEPYPFRVPSIGSQFSLVVILKINNYDMDYLCGGAVQGFSIMFHPPFEAFNTVQKPYYLAPGTASYYTIEPKLIRTSESAIKYPPNIRGCFMNSERKLRFYKFYTRINCEMECFSNYTLDQCECVQLSAPRMKRFHSFFVFLFHFKDFILI